MNVKIVIVSNYTKTLVTEIIFCGKKMASSHDWTCPRHSLLLSSYSSMRFSFQTSDIGRNLQSLV